MEELGEPRLLRPDDGLGEFDCGVEALSHWLKHRAYLNHVSGASRTYVAATGNRVVGYYCLASGSILHREATGALRRNMPNPIPVMVLGRLAVDRAWQGQGLGPALLRHAIEQTHLAARIAGLRALVVHAKTDSVVHFYKRFGFTSSPIDPLMLMARIAVEE